MTNPTRAESPTRRPLFLALLALAGSAALVSACGGGGAFDNPATVANPQGSSNSQRLAFAYFQRCVMPVLKANLPVTINGATSVNSCASAGCHDNATGTGGALRLLRDAADVSLADPALTADAIRATEMYRNFYSAQGESVIGAPLSSRLINKPLVQGVLHGGGLIFASPDDPNAKILRYWITHPMPAGQDEFSTAAANLFTPADINTGVCNTD